MSPPREVEGFRGLSPLTPAGEARMVDVSDKDVTRRVATAQHEVTTYLAGGDQETAHRAS